MKSILFLGIIFVSNISLTIASEDRVQGEMCLANTIWNCWVSCVADVYNDEGEHISSKTFDSITYSPCTSNSKKAERLANQECIDTYHQEGYKVIAEPETAQCDFTGIPCDSDECKESSNKKSLEFDLF
jgi:hypothetical protein